tara:strand:+ start:4139 stop:4465 length:327 start_codon:yes stop_codon:yes gene_type:complete
MNKFEIVLIFNPDLSISVLKKEVDEFKLKLKSYSAKIINEEDWGLRELSYNMNKFKKAFYKFLQIELSGSIIKDLSSELNQSENLLRYLFVKVDEHQELPTKLKNEKK